MKASLKSSTQTLTRPTQRLLLLLFVALLLSAAAFLLARILPVAALAFLPTRPHAAVSISSNAYTKPSPMAALIPPPPLLSPPPPPPAILIERLGVVDANGTMADDFRVGEFSPEEAEEWEKAADGAAAEEEGGGEVGVRGKVEKFQACPAMMVDHVPCWDGSAVAERRCPPKAGLSCLVPAPKNYRRPVWPKSRDEDNFTGKTIGGGREEHKVYLLSHTDFAVSATQGFAFA